MVVAKIISIVALSAALLEGSLDVAMPDKDIDGTLFLVNRQHMINEAYVPTVRKTQVFGMSQSMRADAAAALEEMFATAKSEGVNLASVSGYRSFSKQETIYSRKIKSAGQDTADSLVAIPGTSEHQLGMAMDVAQKGSSHLNESFAKTKAGQWIAANAHRFGFIVRYPLGKEEITGYAYEPWHVRYLGKATAQAVYTSGDTLEAYTSAHRLAIYEFLIKQTNEVLP